MKCKIRAKGGDQYRLLRFCDENAIQWQQSIQLEYSVSAISSSLVSIIPCNCRHYENVCSLFNVTRYRKIFGSCIISVGGRANNLPVFSDNRNRSLEVMAGHLCIPWNITQ